MATIFKYFKKVSFFKKIPQIETLNWIFLSFFFMLRKKLNFVWLREIYRDKWSNFLRVRKKMFFVNSFSFFLSFFLYIYICKLFESCWDVIKARIVTIFTHVEIPLCTRVMKGGELTWNRKEGFVWKLSYLIILFIKTFIRSNLSYLTL